MTRRWWERAGPRLPLALGTLIAFLVGWNADLHEPSGGVDASWQAGLYMATRDGLRFGEEIVWTYGPLGFLKFPATYDTSLAMLSVAYVATIEFLTAGVLVWTAHRALGRWLPAVGIAALATWIMALPRLWELGYAARVSVLVFVVSALAVRPDAPRWLRLALAGGGGILGAIEILGKLNVGVTVVAMISIALIATSERGRYLSIFAGAFAITVGLSWLAAGQTLGNADDYLGTSIDVVRAYSEETTGGANFTVALAGAAVIGAASLLAGAWFTTRDLRLSVRVSVVVLLVVFLLAEFKAAFVAGGGHAYIFFTSALGGWFAFRWRPDRTAPALVAFAALVVAHGVSIAATPDPGSVVITNPLNQRPTAIAHRFATAVGTADAQAELRDAYRLSPRVVALLGQRPVHVSPLDGPTVAWAYRLNWRPLPVFQSYLAMTPELDGLNAKALAEPSGPGRILTSATDAEVSRGFQVSPAALLAMLCRFTELYADPEWQVLARAPDRCGRRRLVARRTVAAGESVTVPRAPGSFVLATVRGAEPSRLDGLASGFRAVPRREIVVNGGSRTYELSSAAAQGLLLWASPGLDYPRPFSASPQAKIISVESEHHIARDLQIDFYAVPARPVEG